MIRQVPRIGLLAIVVVVFTLHGGLNGSSERGVRNVESSAHAMKSSLNMQSCSLAHSVVRLSTNSAHYVRGSIDRPARHAQDLSDACYGFIPAEPSYCVEVVEPGGYVFEVLDTGGLDTTLMLRSNHQQLVQCDDDSAGNLNPRLQTELAVGTYEVYVGTYSSEQSGQYSLSIDSETGP